MTASSRLIAIALSVFFIAGAASFAQHMSAAGQPNPKDSAASLPLKKKAPAKTILFFMNPNGHPCQMQNAIIDNMKDSLKGLAQVTYVKTTEPADRDKFETWAIRGLPSLIIVDKNGKELKRFTPGIQSTDDILAALRGKTK